MKKSHGSHGESEVRKIMNLLFRVQFRRLCSILWLVGLLPLVRAQSSQTFYLKAKLTPENEVPAVGGLSAYGSARTRATGHPHPPWAIPTSRAAFDPTEQIPG